MSEAIQARPGVTIIPATRQMHTQMPINAVRKRRTVGYARVSTDKDEQLNSYEAQVGYYTDYIQSRNDWTFAGIYTDEGITGTSTKKRDGFKQMIQDALDGKYDLIVTKSVSRFARNTVDSLVHVRLLKENGVEVYFEKENIYTFDSKGELLITIMSSLAQEEARSISENVRWGGVKRAADGRYSLPYKQFLGYEKGQDGYPKIVESEAQIVRSIYGMFLEGKTPGNIAKSLTEAGVPSPAGKARWLASTVKSMLSNEKYKGDAILQKTITVDFLTKKIKPNEGEAPKFFCTGKHEAIIDPEVFDHVQQELHRRKKLGRAYSGNSCLSSKLVCGECGGLYGSKVWYSNTKYRRTIWRCNQKYKNEAPCGTPHYSEDEIKRAFVGVFNGLLDGREEIVEACRLAISAVVDTAKLDREREQLTERLVGLSEQMRRHIEKNAREVLDQNEYAAQYEAMAGKYKDVEAQIARATEKLADRQRRRVEMEQFMAAIEAAGSPFTDFDERLWGATVEDVTIHADGRLVFRFKDGTAVDGRI